MKDVDSIEFTKAELGEYKKMYSSTVKKSSKLAETLATTSKQLIWIFTINGILWIWCSYILAFTGHEQIAEALSSNVCNVVIGQMGFYLVTKTIENLSKFNPILNGTVGLKKRAMDTKDTACDEDIPEEVVPECE